MGDGIQVIEVKNPGRYWWKFIVILSFNYNVKGKTYDEIKDRFSELLNKDEVGFISFKVDSVQNFYYREVGTYFINPNELEEGSKEKTLIDSMFDRFCEHYGIYKTGFILWIDIFDGEPREAIDTLKDEIIHSDPE